jgi:hypothetical protein
MTDSSRRVPDRLTALFAVAAAVVGAVAASAHTAVPRLIGPLWPVAPNVPPPGLFGPAPDLGTTAPPGAAQIEAISGWLLAVPQSIAAVIFTVSLAAWAGLLVAVAMRIGGTRSRPLDARRRAIVGAAALVAVGAAATTPVWTLLWVTPLRLASVAAMVPALIYLLRAAHGRPGWGANAAVLTAALLDPFAALVIPVAVLARPRGKRKAGRNFGAIESAVAVLAAAQVVVTALSLRDPVAGPFGTLTPDALIVAPVRHLVAVLTGHAPLHHLAADTSLVAGGVVWALIAILAGLRGFGPVRRRRDLRLLSAGFVAIALGAVVGGAATPGVLLSGWWLALAGGIGCALLLGAVGRRLASDPATPTERDGEDEQTDGTTERRRRVPVAAVGIGLVVVAASLVAAITPGTGRRVEALEWRNGPTPSAYTQTLAAGTAVYRVRAGADGICDRDALARLDDVIAMPLPADAPPTAAGINASMAAALRVEAIHLRAQRSYTIINAAMGADLPRVVNLPDDYEIPPQRIFDPAGDPLGESPRMYAEVYSDLIAAVEREIERTPGLPANIVARALWLGILAVVPESIPAQLAQRIGSVAQLLGGPAELPVIAPDDDDDAALHRGAGGAVDVEELMTAAPDANPDPAAAEPTEAPDPQIDRAALLTQIAPAVPKLPGLRTLQYQMLRAISADGLVWTGEIEPEPEPGEPISEAPAMRVLQARLGLDRMTELLELADIADDAGQPQIATDRREDAAEIRSAIVAAFPPPQNAQRLATANAARLWLDGVRIAALALHFSEDDAAQREALAYYEQLDHLNPRRFVREHVVEVGTGERDIHFLRGELRLQLGRLRDATTAYVDEIKRDPNHVLARYALGRIELAAATADYNSLLDEWTQNYRALPFDDQNAAVESHRIVPLWELERMFAANNAFMDAVRRAGVKIDVAWKHDPRNAAIRQLYGTFYFYRGDARWAVGEYDLAEMYMRQSYTAHPENETAIRRAKIGDKLGVFYAERWKEFLRDDELMSSQSNREAVFDLLLRALQLSQYVRDQLYEYVQNVIIKEDPRLEFDERLFPYYRIAHAIYEDWIPAVHWLFDYYDRKGDWRRAEEFAKRTIELLREQKDPKWLTVLLQLSQRYVVWGARYSNEGTKRAGESGKARENDDDAEADRLQKDAVRNWSQAAELFRNAVARGRDYIRFDPTDDKALGYQVLANAEAERFRIAEQLGRAGDAARYLHSTIEYHKEFLRPREPGAQMQVLRRLMQRQIIALRSTPGRQDDALEAISEYYRWVAEPSVIVLRILLRIAEERAFTGTVGLFQTALARHPDLELHIEAAETLLQAGRRDVALDVLRGITTRDLGDTVDMQLLATQSRAYQMWGMALTDEPATRAEGIAMLQEFVARVRPLIDVTDLSRFPRLRQATSDALYKLETLRNEATDALTSARAHAAANRVEAAIAAYATAFSINRGAVAVDGGYLSFLELLERSGDSLAYCVWSVIALRFDLHPERSPIYLDHAAAAFERLATRAPWLFAGACSAVARSLRDMAANISAPE